MDQGLIPRRYAKALYLYACEKHVDAALYKVMQQTVTSFEAEPALTATLANPHVTDADKVALLTTAMGVDPTADDPTAAAITDFLKLLQQNRRLDQLRDIALAYIALYRQANRIYRVTVTTAAPLAQAETERIHSLVDKHLDGATAEYETRVDPDLIGGFTVAIDNERLDASVANELKQLRLKLLSK